MKAITTVFAVTALAAAISGQAAAEAEFSYSGQINVESTFDLEASTQHNAIVDETDGDNDKFELTMDVAVSDGPFSGTIQIRETEDGVGAGPLQNTTNVRLVDLMAEDGAISFGQIGSVVATDDLLDKVTDEDNGGMSYDVEAGFRYTDAEMGIMVQGEGDGGKAAGGATDFGFGANLTQDIGMGTAYADVQMSNVINATDDGMDANDTFIGVGAELMPSDELTVTVAYQMISGGDSAYGVMAEYAADAITAYGRYGEPSADTDDDETIAVGGSFTADMLTFSADYTMTTLADAGDSVEAGVAYANDNIAAYADVTLGNFDAATADDMILEVGASMTAESGIVYAADYTNQANTTSELVLSAAYSF